MDESDFFFRLIRITCAKIFPFFFEGFSLTCQGSRFNGYTRRIYLPPLYLVKNGRICFPSPPPPLSRWPFLFSVLGGCCSSNDRSIPKERFVFNVAFSSLKNGRSTFFDVFPSRRQTTPLLSPLSLLEKILTRVQVPSVPFTLPPPKNIPPSVAGDQVLSRSPLITVYSDFSRSRNDTLKPFFFGLAVPYERAAFLASR